MTSDYSSYWQKVENCNDVSGDWPYKAIKYSPSFGLQWFIVWSNQAVCTGCLSYYSIVQKANQRSALIKRSFISRNPFNLVHACSSTSWIFLHCMVSLIYNLHKPNWKRPASLHKISSKLQRFVIRHPAHNPQITKPRTPPTDRRLSYVLQYYSWQQLLEPANLFHTKFFCY